MNTRVMAITADNITQTLQSKLTPTRLEVIDESYQHAGHAGANASGVGTHFRVRITSPFFTNLSRTEQHRLVYDALRPYIDQGLHALAIETSLGTSFLQP
ncbi:MAG: BolA family protein [Cytophagales bacterium]|nr:BolA family protein [Cytophagales bacterium]